jgi:glycosyltransferase involved in cell wall biosynthesis
MKPVYSIVAPIYNEEGNIDKLHKRISEVMGSGTRLRQ